MQRNLFPLVGDDRTWTQSWDMGWIWTRMRRDFLQSYKSRNSPHLGDLWITIIKLYDITQREFESRSGFNHWIEEWACGAMCNVPASYFSILLDLRLGGTASENRFTKSKELSTAWAFRIGESWGMRNQQNRKLIWKNISILAWGVRTILLLRFTIRFYFKKLMHYKKRMLPSSAYVCFG